MLSPLSISVWFIHSLRNVPSTGGSSGWKVLKPISSFLLPTGNHFAQMPHVFRGNSPPQDQQGAQLLCLVPLLVPLGLRRGQMRCFSHFDPLYSLGLFLAALPMHGTCLSSGCSFLLSVCKHCTCFVQINLLKVYRNKNSLPAARNMHMRCRRIKPQAASGNKYVGTGLRRGEPQIWSTGAEHLGAKHMCDVPSAGAAL